MNQQITVLHILYSSCISFIRLEFWEMQPTSMKILRMITLPKMTWIDGRWWLHLTWGIVGERNYCLDSVFLLELLGSLLDIFSTYGVDVWGSWWQRWFFRNSWTHWYSQSLNCFSQRYNIWIIAFLFHSRTSFPQESALARSATGRTFNI